MKVDIIFVDVSNSVMLFKLKLTRWRSIEASVVVSFSESNRYFVHVQSKILTQNRTTDILWPLTLIRES